METINTSTDQWTVKFKDTTCGNSPYKFGSFGEATKFATMWKRGQMVTDLNSRTITV